MFQMKCNVHYLPQTKLRQGNVFTPVCDSIYWVVSVHPVSVQGESLSGVSVQGESLSRGSLCPGGVSVLVSLPRVVSVQGCLCPGESLSRGSQSRGSQSRGSQSRGSLSRGSLSRENLCPGGSLSWGVSVQGVSVQGVSVQGVICLGGFLSGNPVHMVKNRRYTSYWNAFL